MRVYSNVARASQLSLASGVVVVYCYHHCYWYAWINTTLRWYYPWHKIPVPTSLRLGISIVISLPEREREEWSGKYAADNFKLLQHWRSFYHITWHTCLFCVCLTQQAFSHAVSWVHGACMQARLLAAFFAKLLKFWKMSWKHDEDSGHVEKA